MEKARLVQVILMINKYTFYYFYFYFLDFCEFIKMLINRTHYFSEVNVFILEVPVLS